MASNRRSSIEGGEESGGKGGALLVLIVIIVIGAVIFSMTTTPPQAKEDNSAGELLNSTIAELANIKEESFTFDGTIKTPVEGNKKSVDFSGEGKIDSVEKKMQFKANFELEDLTGQVMDIESYTIGDTLYFYFNGQWGKMGNITVDWSNAKSFSSRFVQVLQGLDATVTGTDNVNGKDAVTVEATPSLGDLLDLLNAASPGTLEDMGMGDTSELGQNIKDLKLTMWIDKERSLPIKADVYMVAEVKSLNSDAAGVTRSDMTLSGTINFDFDTPFKIVLPSAAQNI